MTTTWTRSAATSGFLVLIRNRVRPESRHKGGGILGRLEHPRGLGGCYRLTDLWATPADRVRSGIAPEYRSGVPLLPRQEDGDVFSPIIRQCEVHPSVGVEVSRCETVGTPVDLKTIQDGGVTASQHGNFASHVARH